METPPLSKLPQSRCWNTYQSCVAIGVHRTHSAYPRDGWSVLFYEFDSYTHEFLQYDPWSEEMCVKVMKEMLWMTLGRVVNLGKLKCLPDKEMCRRYEDPTDVGPDFHLSRWRRSTIDIKEDLPPSLQASFGRGTTVSAQSASELLFYAGTPNLSTRCLSSILIGTPNCWLTHEFPCTRSLINPESSESPAQMGTGFALVYYPSTPISKRKVFTSRFLPESPAYPILIGAFRVAPDAFKKVDGQYPNLCHPLKTLAKHIETPLRALHSSAVKATDQTQTHENHYPPSILFGLLYNDEYIAIVAHFWIATTSPRPRPTLNHVSVVVDILYFGVVDELSRLALSRLQVVLALLTLQRHAFRLTLLLEKFPPDSESYHAICESVIEEEGDREESDTEYGVLYIEEDEEYEEYYDEDEQVDDEEQISSKVANKEDDSENHDKNSDSNHFELQDRISLSIEYMKYSMNELPPVIGVGQTSEDGMLPEGQYQYECPSNVVESYLEKSPLNQPHHQNSDHELAANVPIDECWLIHSDYFDLRQRLKVFPSEQSIFDAITGQLRSISPQKLVGK
ncbi:hypothetical protein AX16_009114 [Volvariella volvacea WC 439]|nr:hypothetical protein AX16_009114 [Volvariella volvacea WC 439]